jgi:flagellar motor switch protein FliM
VVTILFQDLEKAWSSLQPIKVQYTRSEINPQFAKICQPEDVIIINRYEIDMDRAAGSITTCIPMANLASVKQRLITTFQREKSDEDIKIQNTLIENIKNLEVEFKVILGRVTMPAGDIMALESGDILQLDQRKDDLLPAYVAGARKYMGTPGIHRGNKAFLLKRKVLNPERD